MSGEVVGLVFRYSQADANTMIVLVAVAEQANVEGWAWPAVATLAEMCRRSVRHVQYALTSLRDLGELRIVSRGGRSHTNFYRVEVEHLRANESRISDKRHAVEDEVERVQAATSGDPERVQAATEKGASHDLKGANHAERVQPLAPDPSIDPSLDPLKTRRTSVQQRNKKFGWSVWGDVPGDVQVTLVAYAVEFGRDAVWAEREVGTALNHRSSMNWRDTVRGLMDWMRRDAEAAVVAQRMGPSAPVTPLDRGRLALASVENMR